MFEVSPSVQPPSPRFGQETRDAAADADKGAQAGGWQRFDLGVPAVKLLQELLHRSDACRDDRLQGALSPGFCCEPAKQGEGREDFAFDTLLDNGEEEFPDITGGLEVVATITDAAVDLDEAPALQFFEACAHVG